MPFAIHFHLHPGVTCQKTGSHDEALLRDADRPWALKQRIRSRQGHLSNQQACEMLCAIAGPGLRTVFLAQLFGVQLRFF